MQIHFKKSICLISASIVILLGSGLLLIMHYRMISANNFVISKYEDLRYSTEFSFSKDLVKADLRDENLLISLTFNSGTVWPDKTRLPKNITPQKLMEMGKEPGLGISELHARGITGMGVSVAIIDQTMSPDHPEFNNKIVTYKSFADFFENSLHGPAVTSLLAGESIGTAPGVDIYYAAVPGSLRDSKYYAEALDWIIDENRKLPDKRKIRIVSVSACPAGQGSPSQENQDLWDESVLQAEKEGLLVLDTTEERGIIGPCYRDIRDINNYDKYIPGFLQFPLKGQIFKNEVLVPCSNRTVAEELTKGVYTYAYFGEGGLSWGIPYAAGVFALGWQLKPELTPKEITDIMFKTAYMKDDNYYINPTAFIQYIEDN